MIRPKRIRRSSDLYGKYKMPLNHRRLGEFFGSFLKHTFAKAKNEFKKNDFGPTHILTKKNVSISHENQNHFLKNLPFPPYPYQPSRNKTPPSLINPPPR